MWFGLFLHADEQAASAYVACILKRITCMESHNAQALVITYTILGPLPKAYKTIMQDFEISTHV